MKIHKHAHKPYTSDQTHALTHSKGEVKIKNHIQIWNVSGHWIHIKLSPSNDDAFWHHTVSLFMMTSDIITRHAQG